MPPIDPKSLIAPELLGGLDVLPSFDFSEATLPMVRQGLAAMRETNPPPPDTVAVETRAIPGPAGAPDVRVTIVRPRALAGEAPGYLHIHGGGYILGAGDMNIPALAATALDAHCLVVSVDYRLAPETTHPGPVEDCYAALRWLHANAADLGVDAARIAVGGESAGGGLAAALALLARDRGEVPILFQNLIYPMIDDRTALGADPHPHVGHFVWTRASNHFGWRSLLGVAPGSAGVSPYAAAARAEDLTGLPPAFISVGALDLFLEEDMDYARRLSRAGVPIELHVYPGAYHGFDVSPDSPQAKRHRADWIGALTRAFA